MWPKRALNRLLLLVFKLVLQAAAALDMIIVVSSQPRWTAFSFVVICLPFFRADHLSFAPCFECKVMLLFWVLPARLADLKTLSSAITMSYWIATLSAPSSSASSSSPLTCSSLIARKGKSIFARLFFFFLLLTCETRAAQLMQLGRPLRGPALGVNQTLPSARLLRGWEELLIALSDATIAVHCFGAVCRQE